MTPDWFQLPAEHEFPASRYPAARRQLAGIPPRPRWRMFGSWRHTGIVIGLGVGLSVGGGVALANVDFSEPGAPSDTPQGHVVDVTRTGTSTVELGPAPTKANDISLTLTGLNIGIYKFPDGSYLGCATSDFDGPSHSCQATEVIRLQPSAQSITITANASTSWKLQATYITRIITPWRVNARGQTYGVPNVHGFPDLVAEVIDHGRRTGYVTSKDMNCSPSTPAEALAYQKATQGRNISIPAYKSDGTTKIGNFIMGSAGPEAPVVPLSSLHIACAVIHFHAPSPATSTGYGPATHP
jgi:hypothetical protein